MCFQNPMYRLNWLHSLTLRSPKNSVWAFIRWYILLNFCCFCEKYISKKSFSSSVLCFSSYFASCVMPGGEILVFGGTSNTNTKQYQYLDRCEMIKFSPNTDALNSKWMKLLPMKEARSNMAAASLENKLVVYCFQPEGT